MSTAAVTDSRFDFTYPPAGGAFVVKENSVGSWRERRFGVDNCSVGVGSRKNLHATLHLHVRRRLANFHGRALDAQQDSLIPKTPNGAGCYGLIMHVCIYIVGTQALCEHPTYSLQYLRIQPAQRRQLQTGRKCKTALRRGHLAGQRESGRSPLC